MSDPTTQPKQIINEHIEGFDISDLFMSRTDERGVIQSGNSTFKRLAGHDWPDLIGAPHKLIRHPDMPRSAFWRFWSELQNGNWFGAYVKNRAKCGRYYWVFAVALPIEGGFLSVRLKPTSQVLGMVETIYKDLCKAEAAGLPPEDGAEAIETAVRDLGFRDYHAFMGHALGMEFTARCQAMGTPIDPGVGKYDTVCQLMQELSGEVTRIKALFAAIKNSPTNLNILGSRLSTGREPMQVVAQNYGILSDELFNAISKLGDGLNERLDTAFMGRMGYCASLLYQEAIRSFLNDEPNRGTRGHKQEVQILLDALNRFVRAAEDGRDQIEREIRLFAEQTSRLRRMLSGLAMTRVICRIESASAQDDTNSIDEISTRLTVFQDELGKALDRISGYCDKLGANIPHRLNTEDLEEWTRSIPLDEVRDSEKTLVA